ncbi:MAG: hypothetical protein ACTSR8_02655 [Promethearchaeota archaeon]
MVEIKLKDFLIERPIRINEEETHKIILKRGFWTAFIFSIIYGFYEYFVVYNYIRLYDILGSSGNWSIMYISLIFTVAFATWYDRKFNIEQIIMGLFFMAMFEDVIFWISLAIDHGVYPFPAGNWWDSTFASFRVLGGLGKAIPFWPYVPTYYIPGFGLIISFYIFSYYGPKSSRIVFMLIGPLFIAILLGTLHDELFAIIMLISVPTICYIFSILILKQNQWKFIKN